MPLVGVFAKHEGRRRHVIGTPNHAVLIAAGSPYRSSYPGAIGDECLTLWFSGDALERLVPRAVSRGTFDPRRLTSDALLPASAMLTRSLLWQRFVGGDWDLVEIEELGVGLLGCVLHVAGKGTERRRCAPVRDDRVARVKEAVAVHPERRWTLGALAQLAEVSPYYLAHTFREQVGVSAYRYVLRARLAGALDRVLDSDADLTAIALDTGFASHSPFTARFRALFGVTPSDVHRRARPVAELRKIVTAEARGFV